jgi:hypothetical protein
VSEQLKYKLLHFQQKPPVGLWNEVDAALDDQQSSLSKKLYNYKETPPDNNWKKIEDELNSVSKEKTTVTPLFKKFNYKYLTAAVLIIAVSIIAFLIVNDQPSAPANDVVTSTPSNETSSPAFVPSDSDVAITETPSFPSNNGNGSVSTVPRQNQPANKRTTLNDNRYTTVADEDGKLVRLSKKIFPVFDCAENSTAFVRKRCQENIESLQKQMASTIVSPAADFAGLLDMLKKLEENN